MREPLFTTALVTGASSGIGKAVCDLLAEKKINLIVSARDRLRLEACASQWRPYVSVEVIPANLSQAEDRARLVDCIKRTAPDLVINNAGFGFYGNALSHATSSHLEMLEVDCAAVMELTLEAARALTNANKKGTILNVSSAAAFQIFPYFATYASCKAFVNHFSYSLDEELKPQGVRVLAACPGVVKTRFRERAGGNEEAADKRLMTADFAAREIWKQIVNGKAIHVFDWKYRLAILFGRLIPQRLLTNIMKKAILTRIKR